jgi:hypothetical protein
MKPPVVQIAIANKRQLPSIDADTIYRIEASRNREAERKQSQSIFPADQVAAAVASFQAKGGAV